MRAYTWLRIHVTHGEREKIAKRFATATDLSNFVRRALGLAKVASSPGRPKRPRECPKCGKRCEGYKAAMAHCRKKAA